MTVDIWRTRPDGGAYETFEVPRQDSQTVLDVVSWVQQNTDPTLSYRYACRVGMCGSCAMMVNGVPRWTCRTHVDRVLKADRMKIAPLRNLPVVKDLVADMDPFFDKWTAAEARHHPTAARTDGFAPVTHDSPGRASADNAIECINCAVCYAACDTVAGNPDYLGPAALNRAWTLVNDAKDGGRNAILDAVTGPGGCQACHSMGSCAQYCPNELDPMTSIAGLKRAATRRAFGGK
ncbi:MAG: succinate dehydrogenase/fumarate reductase iron-sulfur subunit [Pseudomonadota bacterium]